MEDMRFRVVIWIPSSVPIPADFNFFMSAAFCTHIPPNSSSVTTLTFHKSPRTATTKTYDSV